MLEALLNSLRPTQMTVGYAEVLLKRQQWRTMADDTTPTSQMSRATGLSWTLISKAFDTVDRSLLSLELLSVGAGGRFLRLIRACMTGDRSVVAFPDARSQPFSHHRGVRQGDPLSPLLFLFSNRDLLSRMTDRALGVPIAADKYLAGLLYADDLVLISETAQGLQSMLDIAFEHSQQRRYKFNPPKSAVVVFGSAHLADPLPQEFKLGPDSIQETDSYHYLGVQAQQHDPSFDSFVKSLPPRASLAVAAFSLTASVTSRQAPPRVARMVLMAHVTPHCRRNL